MKKILTIGELRQAIQHLDDHDIVVVDITCFQEVMEEYTMYDPSINEDGLYPITSVDDSITIVSDDLNSTMREVRICI